MLIAAGLAVLRFGAYYWRSLIAGRAAQPLSERFRIATGYESATPGAEDFGALLGFYHLIPEFKNRYDGLCGVPTYYRFVATFQNLPALQRWAHDEMAICSNYIAVLVDRRIEGNFAYATEIRPR
jgi:hypothetical protein